MRKPIAPAASRSSALPRLLPVYVCLLAAGLLLACSGFSAGPAGAEESSSYKKCPDDTQTCLNKMVAKLQGRGWLGIEYEDEKGPSRWKITRVVDKSPAQAAGFQVGDVMVSVSGVSFARNTDTRCVTCEATKDTFKPGRKIAYVVRRKGKLVTLQPTLAALPSDVMAQMVGMHMLQHVQPEVTASNK